MVGHAKPIADGADQSAGAKRTYRRCALNVFETNCARQVYRAAWCFAFYAPALRTDRMDAPRAPSSRAARDDPAETRFLATEMLQKKSAAAGRGAFL